MSEEVMVLGEVNKGINKTSSVQDYESSWLGRWTQLSNEVKFHDQSNGGDSKNLISSEDYVKQRNKSGEEGVEVTPFPMFKVSQKRDSATKLQAYPVMETKDDVGSSSKAIANRMPWMYAQGEKEKHFPAQEKTTQNLLELIRPVRIYATVDSVREINLPEEDGLKGSTVSMKLKGKIFGGYLDLFPNVDHQRKGGVKLQSLDSSKNESSAETDILEMDRLQTIHLSAATGSISSSSTKVLQGKGRTGDASVRRAEIPDMNEEPPLVLDRENSVDVHQGETSNSATQSMNVDNFLSRDCKRVRLEQEPEPNSSRWVKRLKTNASDCSGHDETKSLMKTEEASLGQKGSNNLFLEILKSGINNLQPRNQETTTSQIKNLKQGGGEDITLLHPWIQRWCKKKATSTDQGEGQEVRFEPENQKETERKQYPSIAAMALMGKALSGLNPYGLRKTESLMVWNARDLR
ncbi:unnamed protein product [Microthlaspi erraticum]|uniref:F-box protein n=1 Tax=Microthlaspi erraticum TaxID=1685480 RepID=A0A6D2J6L6_9BRAS|nr:unnamed protein product [Microthlaspi erraticum]